MKHEDRKEHNKKNTKQIKIMTSTLIEIKIQSSTQNMNHEDKKIRKKNLILIMIKNHITKHDVNMKILKFLM